MFELRHKCEKCKSNITGLPSKDGHCQECYPRSIDFGYVTVDRYFMPTQQLSLAEAARWNSPNYLGLKAAELIGHLPPSAQNNTEEVSFLLRAWFTERVDPNNPYFIQITLARQQIQFASVVEEWAVVTLAKSGLVFYEMLGLHLEQMHAHKPLSRTKRTVTQYGQSPSTLIM